MADSTSNGDEDDTEFQCDEALFAFRFYNGSKYCRLQYLEKEQRSEIERLLSKRDNREHLTEEERKFCHQMMGYAYFKELAEPKIEFLHQHIPVDKDIDELLAIGKKRAQIGFASYFGYWAALIYSLGPLTPTLAFINGGIFFSLYLYSQPYDQNFSYLGALEAESILRDELSRKKQTKTMPNKFSFWSLSGWDCFFGSGMNVMADTESWPPRFLQINCQPSTLDHAIELSRKRDNLLFGMIQMPLFAISWRLTPSALKRTRPMAMATAATYGSLVAGRYWLESTKGTKERRITTHATQIAIDASPSYGGRHTDLSSPWNLAGWRYVVKSMLIPVLPQTSHDI